MSTRKKYSYEFRVRCVKAVFNGKRSCKAVAREHGLDSSKLRLWVWFYRKYGKAGLQPRVRREYNKAFKLRVLQTIQKEGISLRVACVRFNITSDSVIMNWQKAYQLQGQAGLISKPKGRPPKEMKQPIKRKPRKSKQPLSREEELLRENEYLKAENELLKKLQALVQVSKKLKS